MFNNLKNKLRLKLIQFLEIDKMKEELNSSICNNTKS